MSPQLSLCVRQNQEQVPCSDSVSCSRRVSHSNSQLAREAAQAFTQSQDKSLERSDDLARTANPLGDDESNCLHLRKRKCNIFSDDCPATERNIHADFLSGIFQDLADVHSYDDAPNTSAGNVVPNPLGDHSSNAYLINYSDEDLRPNKKARISLSSLSRSSKSFSDLPQGNNGQTPLLTDCLTATSTLTSYDNNNVPSVHPVSVDSTAARIVDEVFHDSLVHIGFPCLPATVSACASSCSSNNLTRTSVQAAQVIETPTYPNVEGSEHHDEKDAYGWFVDLDEEVVHDRFLAVAAATENSRAIACPPYTDLTFAATTGSKKTVELDSEVEWAKAADTVDDVLGAVFF